MDERRRRRQESEWLREKERVLRLRLWILGPLLIRRTLPNLFESGTKEIGTINLGDNGDSPESLVRVRECGERVCVLRGGCCSRAWRALM